MEPSIIDRGRGPEIAGTRITVYDVYHYLEGSNWSEVEIADVLGVSPAQLSVALRYIEENRAAVLEVHKKIEQRMAIGNSAEIEAKLEESRKKREKLFPKSRPLKGPSKNGVGDLSRR